MHDLMTRHKVHILAQAEVPQTTIALKLGVGLRSVQRILTEPAPTLEEIQTGPHRESPRRGRPPKADAALHAQIQALLEQEPHLQATEVLRRSRAWGYTGSKSAMSVLVSRLRPLPRQEPIVRFEGLPGEYTQFDFGVAQLRWKDGTSSKVTFFAGRLKRSRFMHVVITPDQRAETLVRSVVSCIAAFGGSSKEWVFDNPRTVRISPIGVSPVVLHPYLRDLVAEYRVIPTLCAPRRGNQKGSVENLVGYVKKSFLFARRFDNLADLETQLAEWLHEVNHSRPCSATGKIPAQVLEEERPFLAQRPLVCAAAEHPLRETLTVTPMGTVSLNGTAYSATARKLGAPATVLLRAHSVEICVGDERCVHVRRDGCRTVQRLPQHREDVLAVLHGRRKQATFRRECLLELGDPAWKFLGQLVHLHPQGSWEQPCQDLYELLQAFGDRAMRVALAQANAEGCYEVWRVRQALREAA